MHAMYGVVCALWPYLLLDECMFSLVVYVQVRRGEGNKNLKN
jgi:hypothetical protein